MADTRSNIRRFTVKHHAARARILAAAADLIARDGVTNTGIEEIRKAAGVGGSQVSRFYPDKRALIRDVIAWQADLNLASQCPPALGNLDSFAAWHQWAQMIMDRQSSRNFVGGCDFGSLAGQLVESDDATRADLADGYQRWIGLFRDGLSAMRDCGDLRSDADPHALAVATLSAMQGGMLLSQTLRDINPLRDALRAALERIEGFADEGHSIVYDVGGS